MFLDGPEAELIQAEESCSGGTCTLPATQHLQVRVRLLILKNCIDISLEMIYVI